MSKDVRWRYLGLHIMSEQEVVLKDLKNAVWDAILRLFGEYGASQIKFSLIEYDQKTKRAIVRCSHKYLEMTRAAIASIIEINDKKTALHIRRVSGTLKSLRKTK